jgi:hypothetical protein
MSMPQRDTFPTIVTVLVLFALAQGPTNGRAATLVSLTHWEGPAVLFPHHAPGIEYYSLIARAHWERGASAPGIYNLQVVLPDGQIEARAIPDQEVSARRLTVLVRASAVRNLRPEQVVVRASVLDAISGATVSNILSATIADFPHPASEGTTADNGPFGWGEPLPVPTGQARTLPRPSPDGFTFVRIPAGDDVPGFFLATTEATNAQVTRRLNGYDPKAGRSDEFALEDPAQPAIGLTPKRAQEYLAATGKADPSGVSYRLPSQAEWLRAARAGSSSAFWWGDEPTHPAGANLLGAEPALPNDTTAPARPSEGVKGFEPNPWGLFHTFGNVAEWATTPSGGFVRLGGHFRTEPASPLPEVAVEGEDATGPDPYVGIRPAFDLTAETGAELIRRALRGNALLADVSVTFDPDRATATLTGTLPEPSLRRAADRRLELIWFLAAVENQIVTPTPAPGQLATLGSPAGPVRRITPLGRWVYEIPVSVRWADPLPVSGSEWWVNIYPAGGAHFAHRLVEIASNDTRKVTVAIERARMTAAGLPVDAPVSIALSLGAEAPTPTDPHVVSNVVPLRWSVP